MDLCTSLLLNLPGFSFHIRLTSINPKATSFRYSVPIVNLEMTYSQFLLSPVPG